MLKRFISLVVIAVLVSGSSASAQQYLVSADRMLDVTTGKIIKNVKVLTDGRNILEVNPKNIPKDIKEIKLGNMTLMPGVIDMHTHITFAPIGGDSFNSQFRETAVDNAFNSLEYAKVTLMAGFTTIRNLGSSDFVDVSLGKAIDQDKVVGPWIFPAAHTISITGGHGDATGLIPGLFELDFRSGIADGVDEVVKAVRYQIKHGAKVIKTTATAGVLSFEESVGAQQYSFDELRAMVVEAARHDIKVAAHAHGDVGILAAIEAGVASIEHGSVLNKEIIDEMIKRGTYLVPTTYLVDAIALDQLPPLLRKKAEYILPIARKNLQMAIASGVKIAFGTDAAVYPHGDNGKEFAVLVKLGMSPIEAIRSATIYAIDLLGVDDRGVIESGKLADMIAVKGNPLEDITVMEDVQFVMKGGKVYKKSKK